MSFKLDPRINRANLVAMEQGYYGPLAMAPAKKLQYMLGGLGQVEAEQKQQPSGALFTETKLRKARAELRKAEKSLEALQTIRDGYSLTASKRERKAGRKALSELNRTLGKVPASTRLGGVGSALLVAPIFLPASLLILGTAAAGENKGAQIAEKDAWQRANSAIPECVQKLQERQAKVEAAEKAHQQAQNAYEQRGELQRRLKAWEQAAEAAQKELLAVLY